MVVRKTEQGADTDAHTPGNKILKICTFKVRPERRGVKLGELLLKQVLWFAQTNGFDIAYVTTFAAQATLVELIEYYGFVYTYTKQNGELVYEKSLGSTALPKPDGQSYFEAARKNYPRFYAGPEISAYGVPIKEHFHEILFPEIADHQQADLFDIGSGEGPKTPGNTIRKVYLCRAQARISQPGAILFFYKGKSAKAPSQAITTVGIFENMSLAKSAEDLRRMAGGRSVYSDVQLQAFRASERRPVKVINFLLANHISPAIDLTELKALGVFSGHPPQSIFRIARPELMATLGRIGNFGFRIQ